MKYKLALASLVIFGLSACAPSATTQTPTQDNLPTQSPNDAAQSPAGEEPSSPTDSAPQDQLDPQPPMETDDAAVEGVDDYTATGFDGISQDFGNAFTYPDGFAVTADVVAQGQGGDQPYLEEQTRHDCDHTDANWKVVSLTFDNNSGEEFKPNEFSVPTFVNIKGSDSEFTHDTYNPEDYEYWSITDTVRSGESGTWYMTACSAPDDILGLLLEPTIMTGDPDYITFRGVLQWSEGNTQFAPPEDYTWPEP